MNVNAFLPPYFADDVPALDILHDYVGIGAEWRASERRKKILKNKRYPFSADRTRSPQWRAGTRRNKHLRRK